MNQDIFEGKWKQMKGQVKELWSKLTDDNLERVGGKYDQFVGIIQEKHGDTREHVEEQVDRWTAKYKAHQEKAAVTAA